jgi:hypothetical protein
MTTEPSQRQDRATRAATLVLEQATADFLRRLPEFQTRSEERIQKVSRELAKALAQAISQHP